MLELARRRTFRRGEVVFHQEDPADSLHLVVQGRFWIARRTVTGEDALLAISGRGDVFGELALVSGRERSATVLALEEGETLCVYRADFEELRSRHSSVDRVLVTLLARQLQRMNELLTEAYYETARRRVLRRLLELVTRRRRHRRARGTDHPGPARGARGCIASDRRLRPRGRTGARNDRGETRSHRHPRPDRRGATGGLAGRQ